MKLYRHINVTECTVEYGAFKNLVPINIKEEKMKIVQPILMRSMFVALFVLGAFHFGTTQTMDGDLIVGGCQSCSKTEPESCKYVGIGQCTGGVHYRCPTDSSGDFTCRSAGSNACTGNVFCTGLQPMECSNRD